MIDDPQTRSPGSMRWPVLVALLLGWAAASQALSPAAQVESRWSFRKEQRQCVLEQHQPGVGAARFTGEPGLNLRFEFVPVPDPFGEGAVYARAETPEWHPAWPDHQERGALAHVRGGAIVAEDPLASQFLQDLRRGRLLRLTGPGVMPAAGDLQTLAVWPLRLGEPHSAFIACRQWTMPANFADMEHTRIGFEAGGLVLRPAERARLDRLVQYILADRLLTGIVIEGHADAQGGERVNRQISRRRAAVVADYLARHGIPRALLTVTHHGASVPEQAGTAAAGEARNRRVLVQLRRMHTASGDGADPVATR